jgi:hypothetical protein
MITIQKNVPALGVNLLQDPSASAAVTWVYYPYWGATRTRDIAEGHNAPGCWRYNPWSTDHSYGFILQSNVYAKRGTYHGSAWVKLDRDWDINFSIRLDGTGGGEGYGGGWVNVKANTWTRLECTYDITGKTLAKTPLRVNLQGIWRFVAGSVVPPTNAYMWADDGSLERIA